MSPENRQLVMETRSMLLATALTEAKQNPLVAAFLGWLFQSDELLNLTEAAASSAAAAKGAERSSRSVAVLGFACGIEKLRARFTEEFVAQLDWIMGRPNFATGGEPSGVIADPMNFTGVMCGAEHLPTTPRSYQFKQWITAAWKDANDLIQESGWRRGIIDVLGHRLRASHAETGRGNPTWILAGLHRRGWTNPAEESAPQVLRTVLNNATSVTDGFEAAINVAALDWAVSLIDGSVTLVFSGGGLRATLFQLGVVAYLASAEQLSRVKGFVSVSGGSILAAHLAVNWSTATKDIEAFITTAGGLVRFARSDIRHQVLIPWLWSRLNPLAWFKKAASRSGRLKAAYGRHFSGIRLGELNNPDLEVAFLATDAVRLERIAFTSREVARFPVSSESIERGQQTHIVAESTGVPLALAVATSSCFPPVFRRMHLDHRDLGLHYSEFKDELSLNDGGVIGNLGLEVLLSLQCVKWKVTRKVLVVDAERPQGDRPGNGPLTDLGAQGSALSQAAVEMARQKLGADISFISLSRRQPEPPGLPFAIQTPLAVFRTDLDAPNWQECHALMLHGFSAAAVNFGDASDFETIRDSGRRVVADILKDAGCAAVLPIPTEEDLKNSKIRPKKRLLLHAALVLSIILIILLISGASLRRIFHKESIPDVANLPLNPTNVSVPVIVPLLPEKSVVEVPLLPKIDYHPFEIQTFQCLVDLRKWKPFGTDVSAKTSPVNTIRRLVGIKKEPIDQIRIYAATEGAGIDIRCLSGQRFWVEHAIATGRPAVDIMHEYHLVADISSVPVGSHFEIIAQLTTWNGLKFEDPWHAFVAFSNIPELRVQMLFPEDRPFKSAKFVCYPNQKEEEMPIDGKFKQITNDPRAIYWEIKPAIENTTYEIQWTW